MVDIHVCIVVGLSVFTADISETVTSLKALY